MSGEPQTTRSQPLLTVDDLAVSFSNGRGPRIQAVDGVRMSVFPGQTLAVVGESGCGKSVTAMSALQLVPSLPSRVDRGEIRFVDAAGGTVDLTKAGDEAIRDIRGNEIAMIFQEPMTSLNPVYSVGDQITEAIRLHRDVDKAGAAEIAIGAMNEVGIPDPDSRLKAYPHQFSGGMRQRVMIAMALACQPRLLLADEPTTALDVTIQKQILDLLIELKRERSMAVMLITHDLGVVAENADVVCVMYAGRVVEYGDVFTLFDRPLHPYTRGLLACIPRMSGSARSDRLMTVDQVTSDPDQFRALPDQPATEPLMPWWPWMEAPQGVERKSQSAGGGASTLVEVEPNHWVGVWANEAARAHAAGVPRLEFRRATAAGRAETPA